MSGVDAVKLVVVDGRGRHRLHHISSSCLQWLGVSAPLLGRKSSRGAHCDHTSTLAEALGHTSSGCSDLGRASLHCWCRWGRGIAHCEGIHGVTGAATDSRLLYWRGKTTCSRKVQLISLQGANSKPPGRCNTTVRNATPCRTCQASGNIYQKALDECDMALQSNLQQSTWMTRTVD